MRESSWEDLFDEVIQFCVEKSIPVPNMQEKYQWGVIHDDMGLLSLTFIIIVLRFSICCWQNICWDESSIWWKGYKVLDMFLLSWLKEFIDLVKGLQSSWYVSLVLTQIIYRFGERATKFLICFSCLDSKNLSIWWKGYKVLDMFLLSWLKEFVLQVRGQHACLTC
jgi:hypothetical protein